jgi:putative transposase
MIIRKGYKFRLKIKDKQTAKFKQFAGCCRFVWNKALALQNDLFKNEDEKILSKTKLLNIIPSWKQEFLFLKDSHSQILQQSLIDLDRAYQDFFRRLKNGENPGYPKFKRKFVHDSFRFPQGFKLRGRHIYLPKLGWYRFYKSREIEGVPKNVTVSRDGEHWYISVQVEQTIPDPCPMRKPSIGLDMGVARFYTCSDGSFCAPINAFRSLQEKLAQEQRKLSRKVKFSQNWKKQKARVQKIHRLIRNSRRDFLHKASTSLTQRFGQIIVEDLRVCNMSRSAKGNAENPGTNVKAKSGLNKSILDQGWGEFSRQLEYKLCWQGKELVKIPPAYTSQTCSACGHVSKNNRKSQSKFVCEKCGLTIHADHNAAINIHTLGQRGINACGDEGWPSSLKQEPSGMSNLLPIPA